MDQKMAPIIIFTGPMFAKKSDRLIEQLERAERAKKIILVVKPKKDTRTGNKIASRRKKRGGSDFEEFTSFDAHIVESEAELFSLVQKSRCDVFAADEIHFFESWFVESVKRLAWEKGIKVFLAGPDLDAWRKPFETVSHLLAIADNAIKLTADCFNLKCGNEARFTRKIGGTKKQFEVGDSELYQAVCGECWKPPQK